jgi:Zn-dependent peptidase ImmA (M78 family)
VELDQAVLDHVLSTGAGEWDAGTVPLAGGAHVVVMNPTRGLERQRATLMEELAHIYLEHKPAGLQTVNGIVLREWKQTHETQAYWVGAAALLPRRVLKGAVTRGMTAAELATQCGVSEDLVGFREKVLGLRLIRSDFVGVSIGGRIRRSTEP